MLIFATMFIINHFAVNGMHIPLTLMIALFPSAAIAYVDPGLINYFFQMLVVALGTVMVLLQFYWRKVVAWFKRRTTAPRPETQEDNDND